MRILQMVVSRHTLALAACAAAVACGSETTTESSFVAPELSVQPSIVTVTIGSSIKLSAAFPSGSGARAAPSEIVWRSASDSIASITATGMVRGLKAGQTRVTATWHGSHGTALVTVVRRAASASGRCAPRRRRAGSAERAQEGLGALPVAPDRCHEANDPPQIAEGRSSHRPVSGSPRP